MPSKSLLIRLPEVSNRQLKEVMEYAGHISYAEAIRQALNFYHKEVTPPEYVKQRAKAEPKTPETPEERAKRQALQYEAKEELRAQQDYEDGKQICTLLRGTESKKGDYYYCTYTRYHVVNPNNVKESEQVVAFEDLNPGYVNTQVQSPISTLKDLTVDEVLNLPFYTK